MARKRKTKYNVDIIIQIDTREKNLDYLSQMPIEKRRRKDGIKIIGKEITAVKPKGNLSYGDISFKYRLEGDRNWRQANFCIEIKKGTDQFSTIYMKKNYDRLLKELDKAVDNNTKMYYVVTDDIQSLNRKIMYIRKFNENTCKTFFTKHLKLLDDLQKRNIKFIVAGNDLGFVIKRLIKDYVTKNKLQYK